MALVNFNIFFTLLKTIEADFASRTRLFSCTLARLCGKSFLMDANRDEKIMQQYGKRIQRCYGCFIPYHLKDMYLGEDVTYFCENCRDETMFHFEDFSKILDMEKLREVTEQDHH